jgi:hypothetical protein
MLQTFESRKLSLVILDNYEQRKKYESDSEEELEEKHLNIANNHEVTQKKQSKNRKKKKYQHALNELRKELPLNFIGCKYYESHSYIFFSAIILFQMLVSMGYNSLYEIPGMILILILTSSFAFRKLFPIIYG